MEVTQVYLVRLKLPHSEKGVLKLCGFLVHPDTGEIGVDIEHRVYWGNPDKEGYFKFTTPTAPTEEFLAVVAAYEHPQLTGHMFLNVAEELNRLLRAVFNR